MRELVRKYDLIIVLEFIFKNFGIFFLVFRIIKKSKNIIFMENIIYGYFN